MYNIVHVQSVSGITLVWYVRR